MKSCTKCGQSLPIEAYAWKNKAKNQRYSWCKACAKSANREHYEKNAQIYKDRAKLQKSIAQDYIVLYLSTHPCVDCGETDILILDLDHTRDKTTQVTSMYSYSLERIKSELQKCEVRCVRCHRIKTYGKDWFRLKGYSGNINLDKIPENYRKQNKDIDGWKSHSKFNPDKEELFKLVWTFPSSKVAQIYGVADSTVVKRCQLLGISKPPRGYWSKIKSGKFKEENS